MSRPVWFDAAGSGQTSRPSSLGGLPLVEGLAFSGLTTCHAVLQRGVIARPLWFDAAGGGRTSRPS
eukprot:8725350-Karenia_brevis.AAC.1